MIQGGFAMKLALLAVPMASLIAFAQPQHAGPSGSSSARPSRMGGAGIAGSRSPGRGPARPPLPTISHPQHAITAIAPFPVFYGAYYYPDVYGYPANNPPPAPAYDYGYADNGPAPVTIMNPGYGPGYVDRPYIEQPDADGQLPSEKPTIYLLAMTDHTIIPAISYWVQGDTLNYITTEASQNAMSLSLLDRDFSRQLNDSRGVEFKLPAGK
jgi:hypothetical protein